MANVMRDFRGFLTQGNLIALAIAFVIGTAFAALVNALVVDLITPIVGALFGEPDFGGLTFQVNDSEFRYGDFINALLTFLSVAAAIFFFVLKPSRRLGLIPPSPAMEDCPRCTTSIPEAASRCPQCTADIG